LGVGVVTLRDLLEEIVGEMGGEDGPEDGPGGGGARLVDAASGAVEAPGGASPRDLDRRFGWSLSEAGGAAPTLAGLVLDAARRLPEEGEEVEVAGFRARVLERRGRALARLLLTPPPGGAGGENDPGEEGGAPGEGA